MEDAVTFGIANSAWASSYVLGVPLDVALVDPPGQRYLPPVPHGGLPHNVALAAAGGLKASD